MSYSSRVGKYLEIITSRVAFISKEMNCFVLSARDVLLGLDMTQAIGFIPACWKNIEGDFTADGESIGKNGWLDSAFTCKWMAILNLSWYQ